MTSSEKLINVFTTWDNFEAGFVQSLLQSNDIEFFVANRYYATMALTGSGAAPITIAVREEDTEKAREIVEQYYKDIQNKTSDTPQDPEIPENK
jgi:hypothetical protein